MESLDDIPENLRAHHALIIKHIDERFCALDEKLKTGFPYGDLVEHRKVHEQYIKDAAERSALWKSVREKTITGIIWAGLILLSTSLWEYLKTLVKQ